MGNTLIARRAIVKLEQLLSSYKPEDILVGIMWSGPDRIHKFNGEGVQLENTSRWVENPTSLWPNGDKVWEIGNVHWDTDFCVNYYKHTHTPEDSLMNTIDNILLVQKYLQVLGIDYFMSSYLKLFSNLKEVHSDVQKYSMLIDYTKFADIEGCGEWCLANQKDSEYIPTGLKYIEHPYSEGYKAYAENILVPFIKQTYL